MKQRMMVTLSLLCCTFWAHSAPGTYESIEALKQYADDPTKLVDAARRFQLQQQDLSNWDFELAHTHAADEDTTLHTSRQEQIGKRTAEMQAVWEYVVSVYPNDPRALNYFGEYWYDFGGDVNKALTYWQRSAALDQTTGFADNNLGIYYFHTGQYQKGISHLQRTLELDETNPDFLYNMAQMYLTHFPQLEKILKTNRKKLYRDAMRYSKSAARYAPDDFEIVQDYAVNFFAGVNFDVEVDWQQAAEAWVVARKLVKNDDQRFYTLLNEGRCWTREKDLVRAMERYQEALALIPDSVIAKELVAKTRVALR